jgi:hypothetical protein
VSEHPPRGCSSEHLQQPAAAAPAAGGGGVVGGECDAQRSSPGSSSAHTHTQQCADIGSPVSTQALRAAAKALPELTPATPAAAAAAEGQDAPSVGGSSHSSSSIDLVPLSWALVGLLRVLEAALPAGERSSVWQALEASTRAWAARQQQPQEQQLEQQPQQGASHELVQINYMWLHTHAARGEVAPALAAFKQLVGL